jgi:hypothetical protein
MVLQQLEILTTILYLLPLIWGVLPPTVLDNFLCSMKLLVTGDCRLPDPFLIFQQVLKEWF